MFHGLDLMVGKIVTKDTSQCIWDITSQYITTTTQPDDQSMQPSESVLHLQVAMLWWPCLRTCLICLYLQKMARGKRLAGTTIAAATVKVMPKKQTVGPKRILRAQGGWTKAMQWRKDSILDAMGWDVLSESQPGSTVTHADSPK